LGGKKEETLLLQGMFIKEELLQSIPTCSSLKKGEFKFHLNRSSLPLLPFLLSDLFKKGSNNLVYDL
jgi:hypothetical protein